MLIRRDNNKLLLLDKAKLLSVKANDFSEHIVDNKIIKIADNKKKNYVEFESFYWDDNFRENSYSFSEKQDLIKKLEINMGSLLTYEDILDSNNSQYPLFNLKFNDTLLIGHSLQNIYIDYFIRLLVGEVLEVIIDKSDFELYKKALLANNYEPPETNYGSRSKKFNNLVEKQDFDIILSRNCQRAGEFKIEGIIKGKMKIEKITLFNQFEFLVIRDGEN
ncbi:hypothetical protein [Streptococcus sobrinus]|uniref:Uncharacterized protein n=2 Tax=Streptococcus sobrinus TaxID=1310 RepID=U2IYS5_9STRE|nr:hypothetical protein [Streptococcus sobrinus]AWN18391.1 hypothetical protein DK181_02600 [Streptococcus sobrinus]AWN20305.1 hypothetical protein DK182_02650 [Streptococcus sobrinus]EMP70379.1 hypothetical protein D823_09597 [Streptococcus sobrinus DSM 20742 = ATCC 33478]ERJ79121.1 hypothetical protein HMPREF1557_00024 [Streptococcus sobrinus W1703]SQG13033.1 Uncharacterised protein [Streptococcus sobrinus]